MIVCRMNVTTVLLFTLLNIWLLYTPTDGKCRGKWLIHACGGGNGKRSDGRLAHAPSDRKLSVFLGWREPDAGPEQTTENERGSSIQVEGSNEEDQMVGGLERKAIRSDPDALDDDVILRSTDLERTPESSMDLTGDVDQSEEDQGVGQEEDQGEDEDERYNRKDRLLKDFWQRFLTKQRPGPRRADGRPFLASPSDVPEDF